MNIPSAEQPEPGQYEMRESRLRSVLKAISYRIIGTITTATIAFIVTGDLKIAATMGAVEPVTKLVIYYLHERAWQMLPRGSIRRVYHVKR